MKTRVKDIPTGFSFQYGEGKRPSEWHFVGGSAAPAAWSTREHRDRARACFTARRSVLAALDDLRSRKLHP